MDNEKKLQRAAKLVSKMIRLEQVWRAGQIDIDGEIITLDQALKTKLKQKFAAHRTECINALNSITP